MKKLPTQNMDIKVEGIRVSIITAVYNGEATIARTIESVLAQTYSNIEYIIIDGLSSDCTISIAESYRSKLEERGIDYRILSEEDSGIYDAMNKGIEHATGDLIGMINSDDWYEMDMISCMVEHYYATQYDLCFANIRMVYQDGRSFIKKARKRKYITSRDWNHPTQFVRKEVYEKYRYACETISDDMDLYFQVVRAGYRIEVIDQVLANFQMGGVSSRIPIREVGERIKRRYGIYRKNGFSRFYVFECVGFEVVKYLLV